MPISYQIDRRNSIVRVRPTGSIEFDEIATTVEQLLRDPSLQPGMNVLSDHSELRSVASTQLVRSSVPLLQRLAERLGSFKCAVVVPRDASYGMARMAEAYARSTAVEIRAFRVRDEAESWLTQESPAAESKTS